MTNSNTDRVARHRAAKRLGLVALPQKGYVTERTFDEVQCEVDAAEGWIKRDIDRKQAAKDKGEWDE